MIITIDRFEGDIAVIETESGEIYNIPRALVPDAREGNAVRITVDREQTQSKKEEIEGLMDELFKD